MNTDPIADYLTRIRNAVMANHKIVDVPCSNMKEEITKILMEKGYIKNYKVIEDGVKRIIRIALKYHPTTKMSAITKLERVSKPGLRRYSSAKELPRVLNGLGTMIISTPKGLMTDKEARNLNLGGEIICYVY